MQNYQHNNNDASGNDAIDTSPRFSTILSTRGEDGRPSDLELLLRPHCQRLRVVDKLSGAAHLLIPSESSLAIRTYCEYDLQEPKNTNDDVFDRPLQQFFDTFQLAICIFVIPNDQQRKHFLDDSTSVFHRAQRIVRKKIQRMGAEGTHSHKSEENKTMRVMLLSSTEEAIESITRLCNAIRSGPERSRWFDTKYPSPQNEDASLVAKRVTTTFHEWADRFELPNGEINVLMDLMGSLERVVQATTTELHALPIDRRTVKLVQAFFGSPVINDVQQQQGPGIPSHEEKRARPPQQYPSTTSGAGGLVTNNPYARSHQQQQQPPTNPPPMAGERQLPNADDWMTEPGYNVDDFEEQSLPPPAGDFQQPGFASHDPSYYQSHPHGHRHPSFPPHQQGSRMSHTAARPPPFARGGGPFPMSSRGRPPFASAPGTPPGSPPQHAYSHGPGGATPPPYGQMMQPPHHQVYNNNQYAVPQKTSRFQPPPFARNNYSNRGSTQYHQSHNRY